MSSRFYETEKEKYATGVASRNRTIALHLQKKSILPQTAIFVNLWLSSEFTHADSCMACGIAIVTQALQTLQQTQAQILNPFSGRIFAPYWAR